MEYAGYVQPAQITPSQNYLGNFKDDVYLLNADFVVEANTLILSLDWFYTGTNPNATIFRNVLTCSGEVAGNGTGPALRGTLPFDFLATPSTIHDVRTIQLETVDPTDCYTVEVGLFYSDGSRVPIQAPDNSFYVNDLIPIQ